MKSEDHVLLEKASHILHRAFGADIHIRHADYLSEPERRNVILRLFISHKSLQEPKSVILKQSLPRAKERAQEKAFARFARDWAALEFLSNLPQSMHIVPTFYGGDTPLNFILIEDLGADNHAVNKAEIDRYPEWLKYLETFALLIHIPSSENQNLLTKAQGHLIPIQEDHGHSFRYQSRQIFSHFGVKIDLAISQA